MLLKEGGKAHLGEGGRENEGVMMVRGRTTSIYKTSDLPHVQCAPNKMLRIKCSTHTCRTIAGLEWCARLRSSGSTKAPFSFSSLVYSP